jgi:tetratricopeptide (TPR) repeat protein
MMELASSDEATRTKRYPGSRPFDDTVADRLIYFGREEEILALSNRILGARLILLFARSGVGKTSLLNAGVAPRLREHALLPVPILLTDFLTTSRTGTTGSPTDRVISVVITACAAQGLRLVVGERTGLWEFFKTSLIWQEDTLLTPVLVFDQFEEIFTLTKDRELRRQLAREIGSLLQSGYPDRLVERMMKVDADQRLSDQMPNVKVVLSLREEYLGALQDLSTEIPGLFKERFRLATMTEDQARHAILGPAQLATSECGIEFVTAPFAVGDDLLKAMLDFLKGQSEVIEPFQLQLLCSHLEATFAPPASAPRTAPIDLAQTGGSSWMRDVVSDFYDAALRQLPAAQRKKARLLCEDGLLTREGFRQMLPEAVIRDEWRCTAETLQRLVDGHLLRTEQRLESLFYEISHDSIARTIHQQRRWHLPRHLKTGIWVGAVSAFIVIAILIHETIKTAKANEEADKLIGYLIAGDLQNQLRTIGSTDLLDQVADKVRDYLPDVDDSLNVAHSENHALARINDGDLFVTKGNLARALVNYQKARTSLEKLHLSAPSDSHVTASLASSLLGVARSLGSEGRVSDAVQALTSAVALRESLVGIGRANDFTRVLDEVEARQALAGALITQQQLPAARKQLDLSIERLVGLGDVGKHDRRAMELLADSYSALGGFYRDEMYASAAAEIAFAKSDEYVDRLSKRFSLSANARMMQSVALNQAAISSWNKTAKTNSDNSAKAQTMLEELLVWDPLNITWQRDWAVNLTVVADLSADQSIAKQSYEKAIHKLEDLVNLDPWNMDWAVDLAEARDSYGRYLGDNNKSSDLRGALTQFDAAMPIFEKVMQIDHTNMDVRLWRDWELIWRADFEGRLSGDRKLQTDLLRKAMDSLVVTQKSAKESIRAADALLYAERVSCLTVSADLRPRASECLNFVQDVEERVKVPLPAPLVSNIWIHFASLETGATKQIDKAELYRSGMEMIGVAVRRRPGDGEILEAVDAAIRDTSDSVGSTLRSERLNLVRAADPGELTGAQRGDYLEKIHDFYIKLDDLNAALVALRGAIEANPTERRLYQKSADLHFRIGKGALASNLVLAQSEFQSSITAQKKCTELALGDRAERDKLWKRHIAIGDAVKGDDTPTERRRINFAQTQYNQASGLLQHEITVRPEEDALYQDLFNLIGRQFRLDWDTQERAGAWKAYQRGIAAAQKAIDLQPDKPDYWHLLQVAHSGVGLTVSGWDEADAMWRARARAALRAAADASRKTIEKSPELPKLEIYFEEIATSLAADAELMEKDSMREEAARTYGEACVALNHATALTTAEAAAKSKDTEEMQALRQRCSGGRTVSNTGARPSGK